MRRRAHHPVLTLAGVSLVLVLALPAVPAAAVTFSGTLAGPSVAAMYPSGLEFDDALSRIVVADTGLDKIQFYDINGTKLGEFGAHGAGNGQFDSPRDAAVGPSSRIFVADAGNNRVQAFDSTGTFLWSRGGTGPCSTCLNTPIGVTWDAVNGQLLVASTGQDLIKAFDANGNWLWSSPSGAVTGIDAPRDANRGPDGRVWVADYAHHQIKAFDVTSAGVWTTTPAIVLGDGVAGGHGDGQLNYPYNVDFNLDGTVVYVSDTGNNRVAQWSLTTTPPTWVGAFGGNCPETPDPCADPPADWGYIDTLRRVVVDPAGNVITADFWGNGIQVWTAGGSMVRQIALFGAPVPGFAQAFGVATAPNGDVYAIDRLNQRIERFSSSGAFVSTAGSRGTAAGRLSWPEGVAVGPDGTVWVADTRNDRIQKWPANLADSPPIPSYGGTGSTVGKFNYVEDLDVGPDGRVWIADTRNNRIQVLDPATSTFTAYGSAGAGNGQFSQPQGIAVSATNVFVADTNNNRIQKLTLTGAWVASFSTGLLGPQGIALAPDGSLWVADTGNNRILHLSDALVDLGETFGTAGTGDLQFDLPHTLAVSGSKLYVADTFNDRVQVFEVGGPAPDTTRPTVSIAVPTQDQVFPNGPITFSGSAADNVGVTAVRVAIKDRTTNLWWRSNGTWGAYQLQNATLGTPGGTSTTWSYAWTPPTTAGSYSVLAESADAAGNVANPKPTNRFSVTAGGVPDTTRPTVSIAVPTQDQVFPNGPITFSGSAADNVGVTAVRVAIKDRTTNLWWRSNGTWGAYQLQNTTLGSPGGTSTTWSYAWTPPTTAGSYSVLAESADAAGNVANPKPTNRFSVTAGGGGGGFEATYSRQVFNAGGIAPVYPAGGATDPSNGDRYIADSGGSRIVKISSSGVQTTVSSAGWNDPRDLEFDVADPNILWVADTSDSQIVQMTRTGSIVSTFGGPSAFQTPYGLANDASGVYVADTYNQRIQKISKTNGSVLWTQTTCFGTAFSRPRDVAVGPDGNLYVADTDNNRIVRLNPTDGSCLFTFGSTGGGLAQFRSPRSLTSDGSTGLWIADAGNNRLKRHLVDGTFVGQAGSFGEGNAQFRSAHCVFRDGVNVDVCDTFNYRIEQFRVNALGKPYFGSVIGGTRPANGGFNGAFDVAYAPDGSMYAVDWFNHRIQKFDAAGNFLLAFGGYSSNDGSLIFPRGVTVASNGNVVVMDSENNRIDVFSSTGTFMSKIKPPTGQTQFLRPYQVAIAPNGTYWVADTGNNRIVNINASGTVLASWTTGFNQPRGVAVDASGNVYVSNGGTSRVDKYSSTGTLLATLASPGSGPSNVQGPYGLRIVGTGSSAMLLIADAGNNRVVAMALDGTPLGSFGAPGTGNGQFNSPRGMDRNPLTGEIAVADFMNNRLSIWTTA